MHLINLIGDTPIRRKLHDNGITMITKRNLHFNVLQLRRYFRYDLGMLGSMPESDDDRESSSRDHISINPL